MNPEREFLRQFVEIENECKNSYEELSNISDITNWDTKKIVCNRLLQDTALLFHAKEHIDFSKSNIIYKKSSMFYVCIHYILKSHSVDIRDKITNDFLSKITKE